MLLAHFSTSPRHRLAALAPVVAALATLATLAAPSPALAQDAQVESGFALQASLGGRQVVVGGGVAGNFSGFQTGLSAGYKTGRIFIGLGLEFSNSTANDTHSVTVGGSTITTSTTTSDSSLLIGPDFQFAILRSADLRVELIGDAALHFGHQFHDVTLTITPAPPPVAGPTGPTESNFLLSYRIAPGVRFWAHKHFALQAVTGFSGLAYFDLPIPGVPATGNNSQHGIFANFGAMGVF